MSNRISAAATLGWLASDDPELLAAMTHDGTRVTRLAIEVRVMLCNCEMQRGWTRVAASQAWSSSWHLHARWREVRRA